jgi:hypothetical protein
MAFMTFDRMYPLPVAGLPLHNLAAAHDSPALRLPVEPVAAAYVAHLGDAVWLVNCTAVEKVCQSNANTRVSVLVQQDIASEGQLSVVAFWGMLTVGIDHTCYLPSFSSLPSP